MPSRSFTLKLLLLKGWLIRIATSLGLVTQNSAPLFRDLNDLEEANPYQVICEWKGTNPTRNT